MDVVGLPAALIACGMKIYAAIALFALGTLTSSIIAGCSAEPAPSSGKKSNSGDDAPTTAGVGENNETPKPGEEAPGELSTGLLGVVTIDVQQVFFSRATARNSKNVAGRMNNTVRVFELTAAKSVPSFITFEASKTGDHALPATLAAKLPGHTRDFIKTTFAATGQPQFVSAIQTAGLKRVLALGAETDVCVLQTILGLRRLGIQVLALTEGLFTEEVNNGPALRRMRQAGVVEISMKDAEALLESGGTAATPGPPRGAAGPPVIVQPLAMGFVLHGLEGLNAADKNAAAKMVRLRELLLISEWFKIPLLAANPQAATNALPQNLKSIITRPIVALDSRPATVKQLAIAGGHVGVADAVASLKQNADVFLVEDALFGGGSSDLEPLYVSGAVPTTYKTLYYELTVSVSDAQWPSQQWVKDGEAKYFDMTKAPEELPPLVP